MFYHIQNPFYVYWTGCPKLTAYTKGRVMIIRNNNRKILVETRKNKEKIAKTKVFFDVKMFVKSLIFIEKKSGFRIL